MYHRYSFYIASLLTHPSLPFPTPSLSLTLLPPPSTLRPPPSADDECTLLDMSGCVRRRPTSHPMYQHVHGKHCTQHARSVGRSRRRLHHSHSTGAVQCSADVLSAQEGKARVGKVDNGECRELRRRKEKLGMICLSRSESSHWHTCMYHVLYNYY